MLGGKEVFEGGREGRVNDFTKIVQSVTKYTSKQYSNEMGVGGGQVDSTELLQYII